MPNVATFGREFLSTLANVFRLALKGGFLILKASTGCYMNGRLPSVMHIFIRADSASFRLT